MWGVGRVVGSLTRTVGSLTSISSPASGRGTELAMRFDDLVSGLHLLPRQCGLGICRYEEPSQLGMPAANGAQCLTLVENPYLARSRFVTYLLRSNLGTAGITITGATLDLSRYKHNRSQQLPVFWRPLPWTLRTLVAQNS